MPWDLEYLFLWLQFANLLKMRLLQCSKITKSQRGDIIDSKFQILYI